MKVTLAKTLSPGAHAAELAISCDKARLLVVGLEPQFIHKTFNLQFVPPTRCAGVKVDQKLWESTTIETDSAGDPCQKRKLTSDRTHRLNSPETYNRTKHDCQKKKSQQETQKSQKFMK